MSENPRLQLIEALRLPDGRWADVLDGGRRTVEGEVVLADLLSPFPVALLERAE